MNLSPVFIQNVSNAFGEAGRRYLSELPDLLVEAARRWDLVLGEPFLLSFNYACAVTRADGSPAVLKIGVPNRELTSEMAALRLYDGQGACRLYEADHERGLLLMERLLPGRMLHEQGTDEDQTVIAAGVMKRLWRPAPAGEPFITLQGWFDELQNLRPRFHSGTGPFSTRLVEAVEAQLPSLLTGPEAPVVLHGDCHHFNILESGRGWLVIDPKGVIGPAGYEVGPYMLNPWGDFLRLEEVGQLAARRLRIFSEVLGMEVELLQAWAVCHSLLSSWWDLTDNGTGGEYSAACGELFLDLKP